MKYKPLFVNMVDAGLAASPSFGVWLASTPATEPAGEIALGGPDPARYAGPMRFAPLIDTSYWTVPLLGVRAGNVSVGGMATRKAILDSGTTAIIMTKEDAKAVHAAIPGVKLEKGGYYNVTGGCKSVNALPDVVRGGRGGRRERQGGGGGAPHTDEEQAHLSTTLHTQHTRNTHTHTLSLSQVFNIAGVDYAVPPRLWVQQIPAAAGEDPDGLCISGIIPGPTSAGKGVVLGDSFMRAWYTLFVLGEGGNAGGGTAKIGFAKSVRG